MNATEHVRAQLSAYLDGALGDPERRAVEGHLGTCPDCRARLTELRATASLIGRLPDPVPSRRLVPRVAAPPMWLAPLRTVTTLASGLSVFIFIATALLANIGGLASGTATSAAAPAAAPAAPLTSPALSSARGAAPAVGAQAPSSPTALSNADTAKQVASATPTSAAFAVTQTPADAAAEAATTRALQSGRASPSVFANPWLWLGLAIATGLIALALQRRLRGA